MKSDLIWFQDELRELSVEQPFSHDWWMELFDCMSFIVRTDGTIYQGGSRVRFTDRELAAVTAQLREVIPPYTSDWLQKDTVSRSAFEAFCAKRLQKQGTRYYAASFDAVWGDLAA